MTDLRPFDGSAVILHLIEAARAAKADPCPTDTEGWYTTEDLKHWVGTLESYLAAEVPADGAAGWEPRTWGEVLAGDRISLGGEFLVKQAAVLGWNLEPDPETGVRQVWHVGHDAIDEESGAPKYCRGCKGRCARGRGFQTFPLKHSYTAVTLETADGQEGRFQMPTGDEVEVLRGEAGRAADRASGRHADMVKADRDAVLAGWAAEAFEVLEHAGLSPEPQAMTAPEVEA